MRPYTVPSATNITRMVLAGIVTNEVSLNTTCTRTVIIVVVVAIVVTTVVDMLILSGDAPMTNRTLRITNTDTVCAITT